MESTLVIKVKYGQTLRRFNAYILPGNDKLDLDMDGLRAKICSLFNFPPDADLKMTYIDEDGDEVTLVDDDDLFDAIRQRLKFLRIDVRLSNERSSKTSVLSSGNSTPPRSPQTENRFPNINAGVAEILKPLPEPVHEAISKLYSDISSKVVLSNPTIADIVESLVHFGNSYRNSDSQPPTGAESSTQNVPFESPMPPVTNSKPSKDDDYPIASPRFKLAEVPSKNIQEVNTENLTESLGNNAKVKFSPIQVDLNVHPTDSKESECVILNLEPSASNTTSGMKKETNKEKEQETTPCFLSEIYGSDVVFTRMGDTEREYPNECPYSGVPVAGDFPFSPISQSHIYPAKRSFSRCADLGTVFHRGVICDGCGVHPITGPRFKSKLKEDFDLCSMCFAKIGNESDYVRMDHPIHHRHSRSFRGLHNQRPWVGPPIIPRILKGCGAKAGRPKLESRFIMDVNVLDGTVMAPCTPFTKIWRMRNNGTLDWRKGTQLLWIGGDKFSHAISVEIEISAGCIPVDKEVDIAVDFIAPELPGRYISYWRMAAPSGQKFGHRVWVLIQVDASLGRTLSASLQDLNLNLPPLSGMGNGPKTIDMNVEPCENNSFLQAIPVKPADELPKSGSEMYFPIDDTLLVGQSFPCPTAPTAPESSSAVSTVLGDQKLTVPTAPDSSSAVSYPADGDKKFPVSTSQIPPLMYPVIDVSMPAPVIVTPPPTEDSIANKELEESLLKELEEMGFKQVDLNKEVLRINEYNLEQSVDDLCGVSEWDPILEELEEMGFCDKVMNKKLLVKNNGSIKHVVMDLISGEKA